MDFENKLTRRRFVQQTFAFSATAMLAGCGSGIHSLGSDEPSLEQHVSNILMVGDWGTASSPASQAEVAAAMQTYAANQSITVDALLLLGDNFYGSLPGGSTSSRWQTQFEQTYPSGAFNCPAYAVLGNHDYQVSPTDKVEAELAYAGTGNSRFTMPSKYYRFTFPAKNPVITFIALDSNMPDEPAQPLPPDATYYTPDKTAVEAQQDWLTALLKETTTTPFLSVIAHHPLYSNGPHGDNQTLIRSWDPLLRQHGVHLYLAGHDHDLQHLEFAGHPTSFVLSGGGGAELNALRAAESSRGPFKQEVHGFTHLQLQATLMTVRHINADGVVLHAFSKTPSGIVTLTS